MSDFPWLDAEQRIRFPSPLKADKEGLLGAGGNLSPGMLLSAYEQGIFPWFNEDEEGILWWSPDPRFVLFPEDLHLSQSLKKRIRKNPFTITHNKAFPQVITACAEIFRPEQPGTWITPGMIDGYCTLHKLGVAHSFEAWDAEGVLAGGFYGVEMGKVFCGESMFARQSDASKVAFALTVPELRSRGFKVIDCQVYTDNLARFGARNIPRSEYLKILNQK